MFASDLVRRLEDKLFSIPSLTKLELKELEKHLDDIDVYIEKLEKKTEV